MDALLLCYSFLNACPALSCTIGGIMNTNISAFLQPLNEHLQAVLGQAFTREVSLLVVVTEPRRCMILFDPKLLRSLFCTGATELSNIENFDFIFKPLEVYHELIAQVRLARAGRPTIARTIF
ncbi:hypothetical protein CPB84DRAFT_1779646, partial [Gymnopilus junonius]